MCNDALDKLSLRVSHATSYSDWKAAVLTMADSTIILYINYLIDWEDRAVQGKRMYRQTDRQGNTYSLSVHSKYIYLTLMTSGFCIHQEQV